VSNELDRIAVEAYQYLYPMVLMEITRGVSTGSPAGVKPGVGPANAFSHMRAFPPGDFKDVVRPNFDTLYSMAWLDLSDGPLVLSLTRPVDRYFMLPMLDMWTDVFAVVGTRTTGGAVADYAIVPPDWDGTLPEGMERINAPTPHVWIIGRTQANGADDFEAVNAIQDGFRLSPLSTWPDRLEEPLPGDPDVDLETPPLEQVNGMSGEAFFALATDLLALYPPHRTDQPILARMRRLGIEPGRPLPGGEAGDAIAKAPAVGLERMQAAILTSAPIVDGWTFRRSGVGVFGTDYLFRATVAMVGLGANLPEDAVYPLVVVDANGEPPVGDRDYVLHFEADELPPVDAFWSVTMYDADGFTVPNELDRYALGDRNPLRYGDDGSLDLLISQTDPGDDRRPNWLPAAAGPLGLTMRLYSPRPEVLDGRWNAPPLRPVD
jgi:hypothetical protein